MKSVKEFLQRAKAGDIDIEDFLSKVLEKTEKIQEKYQPFITINKKIEGKFSKKLFGLPISVKDCICTKDIQTTAGSKILEGYMPPFDATCIAKIKKEGGFILGKTAQDEFGFGTFCTNCAYVVPKNPYDVERSCGGSSGGAGCITAAADFPHIAIAESTGGSITAPAAFTGTIGLTPTYGRVSRFGLIDYANSMDKIGVIAKEVFDVAFMFSIIAGYDPLDSTSQKLPEEDFTKYLDKDVKGMKIGVPKEYFGEGVDERIAKLVWQKIKQLESLGAHYEEISLPMTKYAIPAYYIIAVSEASTNLAKYCGMRYGATEEIKGNFEEFFAKVRSKNFGEEAKRRIILGTYARMAGYRDAYYLKALKIRTKIIQEFKQAFKKFDVLAAPSMPVLPLRFDEIAKLKPIENYMMDILTIAPNMAGIPMISLPAGFINGLPAGLHLMADHFQEGKLITTAGAIE
ncbi:MAG: Asp-tRNA(Asn)/Glu-tRNA(Gln) amidotransferase subunit GatA [Candidatus Aenigmarchaeota archaeon]|nr:Asp-tRNA(Asn)/Glu-tRNA(Gln) amidotransferase subunit GatA [Candidatus Aenigmarchaeota archaeon]